MKHAVIMAGGSGSRLWPVSRKSAPKQFQKLIGDKTLFQQTYERIKTGFAVENIWVVTNSQYVLLILKQVPELKKSNIISEPVGRNTAAATLLAAKTIVKKDPSAVLFGLVPADHYIGKEKIFTKVTNSAIKFLENKPEYVATIGIHPTEPSTGMGYIKMGQKIGNILRQPVYSVESFHEKPNKKTAEKFINDGEYLWNAGYYLFNGKQIITYFEKLAPKIFKAVNAYLEDPTEHNYLKVPSEPIDKAISEKLEMLAVFPARMNWSDIGNWAALHEVLESKGRKSKISTNNHVSNETKNTLVMGGNKLIATIGLRDVVVIDTEDVILVCDKGSVQDVKKVVEQLQRQGKEHLL